MSIKIHLDTLSQVQREKISTDLQFESKPKAGNNRKEYTDIYDIEDEHVIVPLVYGTKSLKIPKPTVSQYTKISPVFTGELRDHQKQIKDEAIKNLNAHNACLIACYPGFGKTITSIYMASKIKLKTLIILNRLVLMKQWTEAINKFCPSATVSCIKPSSKSHNNNTDFIIINAINIPKMKKDFFSDIGTVIVDEAHLVMSTVLSRSLRHVFPKYIIGLSATPYRSDGLNILFDLYFTEHKIIRNLYKKHLVYQVNTGFTPEMEYDRFGKVIWGKVLEAQSSDIQRNDIILSIIKAHPTKTFLVLSKRLEQAKYLYEKLLETKESVDMFIESNTDPNKECRVLIGTTGKLGVGFDHPKLDALILASDLEAYFIQYLGRVFRREDVEPVVFDLVDNNGILKKHFSTRKGVYIEAGGTIKKYISPM